MHGVGTLAQVVEELRAQEFANLDARLVSGVLTAEQGHVEDRSGALSEVERVINQQITRAAE